MHTVVPVLQLNTEINSNIIITFTNITINDYKHSSPLFSNTLRGLLKKRKCHIFEIQSETKKLYKPKHQMRASLCHVIKREHTNIKH